MSFRVWLEQNESPELLSFIQKVKQQVLQSMRPQEGSVAFRFPKNYAAFVQAIPTVQMPVRLAAATSHPGPEINESIADDALYGKGELAYKAIKPQLTALGTKFARTPQEIVQFQNWFKRNIGNIGQELGFLFEIETLIYLVKDKGLAGYDPRKAAKRRKEIITTMSGKIKARNYNVRLIQQIVLFMRVHAQDMGNQLLTRTQNMLKDCTVDTVEFIGGESTWQPDLTERDPADLVIGCGNAMAGQADTQRYNLKFSSETKVPVASFSYQRAYQLLNGTELAELDNEVDEMWKETQRWDDVNKVIVQYLARAAQVTFNGKNGPSAFADLVKYLISGDTGAVPASRLYIRSIRAAGFSEAMRRDFIIRETGKGVDILPRPGATIEIAPPKSYLGIKYQVPNGSRDGTVIRFAPWRDKVNVKINNLA